MKEMKSVHQEGSGTNNVRKMMFCFCLPEAKDVYDAILPVFVLSKILGVAPFAFRRLSPRHFEPHCGPVTLIRIIVVIGTMGYIAVLVYDPNAKVDIGFLALRFELYFGAAVTSIILILAVTNQKLLLRAIDNIIRIDHDMIKIGINVTYKNAQRFSYFQICGISCVFMSKLILQPFSPKKQYIFVYNVFNVVDYINTIMLFQYVDILLLLRQRYIWLNRELKTMCAYNANLSAFKLTSSPNTLHFQGNVYEKNGHMSPENFLTMIGKLHMQLFDTAKLVNRTYGVQLLSTICARFIMITTQLINTYKIVQDPNKGDDITYTLIAIYLFLHSSKVFMVASISENTAAKARDTGVYLHKLWDTNSSLKDKISFFSLQVLHQNLKFTAAGFFVLDYTLIHSECAEQPRCGERVESVVLQTGPAKLYLSKEEETFSELEDLLKAKLDIGSSIFQCELLAIREAVNYLEDNELTFEKCLLHSYSRSALQAIEEMRDPTELQIEMWRRILWLLGRMRLSFH